jgi:8-oxo-dGTP diphosphatase
MRRFCWRCGTALDASPPTTCTACGQAHYLNPAPCGEAVVVREGKVLLLARAMDPYHGFWDVPGGFCDAAEHPMHAAERELAEELGLSARATDYIGAWIDVYGPPAPDGIQLHCITSAYLMELEDPDAEPRFNPDEATGFQWFALDALPGELAFPEHARPMLAAAAALVGGTPAPLPDRTW